MQFTKEQINVIWLSLQTEGNRNQEGIWIQRIIPTIEQFDAASIFKKLQEFGLSKDEQKLFIDCEIELSTAEKALLLKYLDRPFPIEMCSLVEEIKKIIS